MGHAAIHFMQTDEPPGLEELKAVFDAVALSAVKREDPTVIDISPTGPDSTPDTEA